MSLSLLLTLACIETGVNDDNDNQGSLNKDTAVEDTGDTGEVVIPGTKASAKVYANTSTGLYEIDPETAQPTYVGDFHTAAGEPIDGMVDIAIDLKGRIYGGTYDGLFTINSETAEVELVCATSTAMFALAFSSDGRLFAGGREGINLLDIETCRTEWLIGDEQYTTSGDIVGLPDGNLYWTVFGDDGDDLVLLDPDSGATKWLGSTGVEKLFGVGYDNDTLYGFSSDGEIVRINPKTGAGQIRDRSDSLQWWGATTNPVRW
ncbi:MAG: hypothetical protein VX899_13470 [Myxococcota bacterium]|nr:hypothetical protein [Myxococcota bacterium]